MEQLRVVAPDGQEVRGVGCEELPGTGLNGRRTGCGGGGGGAARGAQHISWILRKELVKSEFPKDGNEFPDPGGGQGKAGGHYGEVWREPRC